MRKTAAVLAFLLLAATAFAASKTDPKTLTTKRGTIGTWSSGIVSFTLSTDGSWTPGEGGTDFSVQKKWNEREKEGFKEGFIYMNSSRTKVHVTTESLEGRTVKEIDEIVEHSGTPYFKLIDTKDLYGINIVFDLGERTLSCIYVMTRSDGNLNFLQAYTDYEDGHVSAVTQTVEKSLRGVYGTTADRYLMYMHSTKAEPKFLISSWGKRRVTE